MIIINFYQNQNCENDTGHILAKLHDQKKKTKPECGPKERLSFISSSI